MEATVPAGTATVQGMVWVPAGTFTMGSDHHYPEEAPAHPVAMDGFWIDRAPVTNAEFTRFVEATGYRTTAEQGRPPLGGAVFHQPDRPVPMDDPSAWWRLERGADWRHPRGPGSSIDGREDHPVVQVSLDDARAYAAWAGKSVPTEAQWEHAARYGAAGEFAWGDEPVGDPPRANVWRGRFPWLHEKDAPPGTTPVGRFPATGLGLVDVAGNVWEWTADHYRPTHASVLPGLAPAASPCCGTPRNPTGPRTPSSDPRAPGVPLHVVKGGSFLCSDDYCFRYRPPARQPQAADSCTCHLGFRCVVVPEA